MLCLRMGKVLLAVATLFSLAFGKIDQHLRNEAFVQGQSVTRSTCRPLQVKFSVPANGHPIQQHSLVCQLEGCQDEHIKEADLVVTQERSSWNVLINRGQENVSVEADPCLQHTFQFLLFFTQSYEDTHGVQIARSAKNEYNKKGNENYLYGGLLATEVLPNICLKENGTISTSDLPQALQYCGVAFSHVEGAEFHRCHSNCNHDDKETGQAAGRIPHICLFSPTDKNFG